MDTVLTLAYAAGAAASALLYIPMLAKILRDKNAWRGHSLPSWGGWLVISMVNLAYAARVNGDTNMIYAAAAGSIALGSVVALLVWSRFRAQRFLNYALEGTIMETIEVLPLPDNDKGPLPDNKVAA